MRRAITVLALLAMGVALSGAKCGVIGSDDWNVLYIDSNAGVVNVANRQAELNAESERLRDQLAAQQGAAAEVEEKIEVVEAQKAVIPEYTAQSDRWTGAVNSKQFSSRQLTPSKQTRDAGSAMVESMVAAYKRDSAEEEKLARDALVALTAKLKSELDNLLGVP